MKERDNFLFWKSYWDAIRLINDAEQATELLRSICLLAFDGEDVEPKGDLARLAWVGIRPIVANNRKNFVNGCKGGEFGGKGKEFGRLGGAPIGNQNARKQPPEQPPQTTPNNPRKDKGKRNNDKGQMMFEEQATLSEEEISFSKNMGTRFPSVWRMSKPLTLAEYNKLREKYTQEQIKGKLERMENTPGIEGRYTSTFLTLKNWLKDEQR